MILKDILGIITRIVIILLFLAMFVINIVEIHKFISSRTKMLTVSSKETNPSSDSLSSQYCNYSSIFSEEEAINSNNLKLTIIYIILFFIFWYNTIINLLTNTAMSNEIKIVFYKKYFNYDIYKNYNYEYTFMRGLQIFILISLLFNLYNLYSEFTPANEDYINIYNNIKKIDKNITSNIDCNLIKIHDPSKGKYITKDTLKAYLEKNTSLKTAPDVDKYFKICISIILINKNSNIAKKTIKDVQNLCDNTKCIYSRLENKMGDIFPENIDKYIDLIRSTLGSTTGYTNLTSAHIGSIYIKYGEVRKELVDSFNIINNFKSSHVIYYKLGLLTTVLVGIFVATFGLAYFLIYDIDPINKVVSGSLVVLPMEYFVNTYFNTAIVYIITIISIYMAFVINF